MRGPVIPIKQHEFFNSVDKSLNDISINSNENRHSFNNELKLPAIRDNRARAAPSHKTNQKIEMRQYIK